MAADYLTDTPKLFAVVQLNGPKVVARGLLEREATSYANLWKRQNGKTVIVPEVLSWQTTDQVLESLAATV
jgi:hypothetical protein